MSLGPRQQWIRFNAFGRWMRPRVVTGLSVVTILGLVAFAFARVPLGDASRSCCDCVAGKGSCCAQKLEGSTCCGKVDRSRSPVDSNASDHQRVRWAIENDAPIPAEVLSRLAKRRQSAPGQQPSTQSSPATGGTQQDSPRDVEDQSKTKTSRLSGDDKVSRPRASSPRASSPRAGTQRQLVYGLFARHCSGDHEMGRLDFTVIVIPVNNLVPMPSLLSDLVAAEECLPFGEVLEPLHPPPQFA